METSYESWLADVVRRGYVVETCQVEPFTYVKMKYIVNGVGEFIGHGFAKKSPDDYWSPSSGVDIARIRAVSHIVGQLLERRGDMWLDSAGKAKERADKAKADLDVANKKIADMMDAMRDAVNDAKAEEDDGAPKPKSRVVVMNRPDEVVMFATINRKAADQIVRIASRFGSARVAENGHVWLYLNPCYDKQEVLDWLKGQIHRESVSMRIKSEAAEFESKLAEAQAKMDEAEAASGREGRRGKIDLRKYTLPRMTQEDTDRLRKIVG